MSHDALVSAFRFPDKFLLYASNQTTTGLWIAREPAEVFQETTELGERVLRMLDQPVDIIPHPKVWNKDSAAFYIKAAGCRSHKQFMEQSVHVSVSKRSGKLLISPTRRLITRRAWENTMHADVVVKSQDPQDIRDALLKAFELAE